MPTKEPSTDAERISQHEKQEYAWRKVAEEKNYRCEVCGGLIIYDEKDGYYLTNMCVPCDKSINKKD